MRRMTNTKGFTLYEVLLVLSIIGGLLAVGVPAVMKGYRFVKIQDYIEHLELVTRQVQSYQFYRVKAQGIDPDPDFRESLQSWPADVNALMNDYSSRFWESCSEEEEAAEICIRPDYVPFSQGRLTLEPVWDTTILPIPQGRYYITVPIGQLPDDGTYGSWKAALLKFPGARVMPNFDIRITVKPLTKTLQYREYLQKDGSTPLEGDWDTGGNYAITNVKGLFLRNSDGSQFSVASGLQRRVIVTSGSFIPLHSCPEGHTPDIDVMIKSIEPQSDATKFTSLGAFIPYYTPESGGWRVYAKYYAKLQNGSQQWDVLNDAYLKVTQICVQ